MKPSLDGVIFGWHSIFSIRCAVQHLCCSACVFAALCFARAARLLVGAPEIVLEASLMIRGDDPRLNTIAAPLFVPHNCARDCSFHMQMCAGWLQPCQRDGCLGLHQKQSKAGFSVELLGLVCTQPGTGLLLVVCQMAPKWCFACRCWSSRPEALATLFRESNASKQITGVAGLAVQTQAVCWAPFCVK